MKLIPDRIKYSVCCAILFPVIARINFHNTGLEYDYYRYIAPFLIGGIAGFLIGLMKDRWVKINSNLESLVHERTGDLNNKIQELNASKKNNIQLIGELKKALKEVKTLSGFLPICSHCKKVRNDNGYWDQIETYIKKHSEAQFSHSICPDCAEKYYPDFGIYKD